MAKKIIKISGPCAIENCQQALNIAKKVFLDSNTISLVVQSEKGLCAYFAANIHPALHLNGMECMGRELFVKEDFRRFGFGGELFFVMELIAKENGAVRVSLVTNLENEMQKGFYDNIGYKKRCDFLVKYL